MSLLILPLPLLKPPPNTLKPTQFTLLAQKPPSRRLRLLHQFSQLFFSFTYPNLITQYEPLEIRTRVATPRLLAFKHDPRATIHPHPAYCDLIGIDGRRLWEISLEPFWRGDKVRQLDLQPLEIGKYPMSSLDLVCPTITRCNVAAPCEIALTIYRPSSTLESLPVSVGSRPSLRLRFRLGQDRGCCILG